jgi:hypothetical protein
MMKQKRIADEVMRRGFVARIARTLLGVGMAECWVTGQGGQCASGADSPALGLGGSARRVIYLYMDGGMSHVDTWDPKQGEVAGPTRMIPTAVDGLFLGEYLPRVAKWMGHGAVVRSLTSTQGAHEQGNYFMHTSYQLRGTIAHPAMGAWLGHFDGPGNPGLPASVYIGNASRHPGAGFFPPGLAPLFVHHPEAGLKDIALPSGVTESLQSKRMALAAELDTDFTGLFGSQRGVTAHSDAYDGAYRMMRSADIAAFDLTREDARLRDAYGKEAFGQGCLLARRLVQAGVRFVEVGLHGWDTHAGNFTAVPDLCAQVDRALSALLEDLERHGMLKDTLVVVATEFGRTPRINVNLGRDHYPKAFSCAMFGGGIRGGTVLGSTNARGEEIESDEVGIPDFNATIAYALGLPLDQVVMSPSQRPFRVADKGKPLKALFV